VVVPVGEPDVVPVVCAQDAIEKLKTLSAKIIFFIKFLPWSIILNTRAVSVLNTANPSPKVKSVKVVIKT